MRRWGLAWLICAASTAPRVTWAQATAGEVTASAPERDTEQGPEDVVYGAMPGGVHALSAEPVGKGVAEVSTLAGYGYRKGLLGTDERLDRAIGDIAAAFGATQNLSFGISLDGRYDRHYGSTPSPESGYVGDPHFFGRFSKQAGSNWYGLQLGIWLPGHNAPSIVGGATSADLRAITSFAAGPTVISLDAGFRLDNSAKSATNSNELSVADQASLGVSSYNAILAGAQIRYPMGKAWLAAEGSLEAYVGTPATGMATLEEGTVLIRGALVGGLHFNDTWSGVAYVEGAKSPGVELSQVAAQSIPLIPYEPVVTVAVGIQATFGGTRHGPLVVEKDCHRHNPPDCPAVKVPITADVTGTVVDESDKPVVGAKVTLTLKNSQVPPTATDEKGTYVFKGVPIGTSIDNQPTLEESGVDVNVEVANKKPGKASIAQVAPGSNTAPPIKLEPELPPGQLRGVVRSLQGGKPIVGATIAVEPGDKKIESDKDGTFQIDLAPGQYKIKVTAVGMAPQDLDVVIDPNGVAIKNIDLHR
jgi:hypothetical protein